MGTRLMDKSPKARECRFCRFPRLKKVKVINNRFQLPYPDQLSNITAISSGKVTPLYSIMKHYAKS